MGIVRRSIHTPERVMVLTKARALKLRKADHSEGGRSALSMHNMPTKPGGALPPDDQPLTDLHNGYDLANEYHHCGTAAVKHHIPGFVLVRGDCFNRWCSFLLNHHSSPIHPLKGQTCQRSVDHRNAESKDLSCIKAYCVRREEKVGLPCF